MPPATLTATGPLSIPFAGLAKLVAASPTFRAVIDVVLDVDVGTTTASEALAGYVHYPYINQREDAAAPAIVTPELPWAIITDDDAAGWQLDKRGSQNGGLVLTLELPVDAAYVDVRFKVINQADAELEFRNTVGAILTEMFLLANNPAPDGSHYWNLVRATKHMTPILAPEDEFPIPFFAAAFLMDWNL